MDTDFGNTRLANDWWTRWYDANVADRVRAWRRWRERYRGVAIAVALVVVIVLTVNFVMTVAAPLATWRGDTALERELDVVLLPVDTVALQRHRSLDALTPVVRLRCREVPIDELRRGRTTHSARGDARHTLTNLVAANRHLIREARVGFAAPKMYDLSAASSRAAASAPDACVLSIQLSDAVFEDNLDASSSGTGGGDTPKLPPHRDSDDPTHRHIVDMVNPTEIAIAPHELRRVMPEQVELRDMLFHDPAPHVWIESVPRFRVRYRTLVGDTRAITLRDTDAHLMRVALRLLNRGEPVSSWGTPVARAAVRAPDPAVQPPPLEVGDRVEL